MNDDNTLPIEVPRLRPTRPQHEEDSSEKTDPNYQHEPLSQDDSHRPQPAAPAPSPRDEIPTLPIKITDIEP